MSWIVCPCCDIVEMAGHYFSPSPPFLLYTSVPARIMTSQCVLSSAISVVIWFLEMVLYNSMHFKVLAGHAVLWRNRLEYTVCRVISYGVFPTTKRTRVSHNFFDLVIQVHRIRGPLLDPPSCLSSRCILASQNWTTFPRSVAATRQLV